MKQLHLPFPGDISNTVHSFSDGFFLLETPRFYQDRPFSSPTGWPLGQHRPILMFHKEMTMESIKKDPIRLKSDSFPVTSLFLKWYLCRATLVRNRKIRKLLEAMDKGRVPDPQQWASLLRMRILGEAFQALNALLERQLTPGEVANLFERIEEFVQLYAIGLRT